MSRRARGEGSVFRRADGSWIARVDLEPGPDGKRRQRSRRAKTKAEALAKLRALQEEAELLTNPEGPRRTVSEAVELFLSTKAYRTASTHQQDLWKAGLIDRGIGSKRTGELTVAQCDEFLRRAMAGEYGRRTMSTESVRRLRRLLVNALRNEMRLGNLIRNVADLSNVPAPTIAIDDEGQHDEDGDISGAIRRTLTPAELRSLWRAARYPLAVIVDLCGRNGLRPSEARALRWGSIDLEAMTLTVDRQMSKSNRLTKVKTKRAARTIAFDENTAEVIQAWRRIQNEKKAKAGDKWSAGPEFVVTTRYGTPINAANLRRMVTAACEEAAVDRIVPYELRHTAITFQVEAGHEAWEVADWAGTSARMVEDIYRHRLQSVACLSSISIDEMA